MMPQYKKVLRILQDGLWHCTNEFYASYMADPRRRICDLKEKGYQLENRRCQNQNHKHIGGSKEWRIKPESIITETFRVLDNQGKVEKEFNAVRYVVGRN